MEQKCKPLISIIMSVYNGDAFLGECIDSVLTQSYHDFEFICINDGSKDGSLAILKQYAQKDNRIIIIDKFNSGLTKSLNIGLELAKGKYIARIDADDTWVKEKLEKQVYFMESDSTVLISGTNLSFIDKNSNSIEGVFNCFFTDRNIRRRYLSVNSFAHSSVMFVSSIIGTVGKYNESYRYAQDYEYWCRILSSGKGFVLEESLLKRRMSGNMITLTFRKEQLYNNIKAKLCILFTLPVYYLDIRFLLKDILVLCIPNKLFHILKKLN